MFNCRPRSEASEGYVFAGVCYSLCSTRGGGEETPNASWDRSHGQRGEVVRGQLALGGWGEVVRGQLVLGVEVVRGQPPPPSGSEVNHLPQGQRSTTFPGSEVNHLPPRGQRSTTSPLMVRGQPPPPHSQRSTTPTRPTRIHTGTMVNVRSVRILLEMHSCLRHGPVFHYVL